MFQMSSKKAIHEIEKAQSKPGGALRETIKLRKM
jgi:hypothetical protein